MAGKFEWQFKYRDEGDVNARTPARCTKMQEVPEPQAFLRTVRFGLPCRFSDDDNHPVRRRRTRCALLWQRVELSFPAEAGNPVF